MKADSYSKMWLLTRRSAQNSEQDNQRRSYRQSIELPIAIDVAGLPAPVYGTLINISETGCRLRSLILIDRDRDVNFELKRPGNPPFLLKGRIVTRATPPSGGGYDYGVTFGRMSLSERADLAKEILAMQRREGATSAEKKAGAPKPVPKVGKQRRTSVRTMVEFPTRYRIGNKPSIAAAANDISTGGLRLICEEPLAIGTDVELQFKLPSGFLSVYPPAAERTEITPFGTRSVRIPDNRRPFEEMTVRGRVVSRFQPMSNREVYGVQFTEIDGYQREEIARFTHAVQLAKLRTE